MIVTSFNNTIRFQRNYAKSAYDTAYLDSVSPEQEASAIGATFRISHDCGVTFGPIMKSPVTSPHGPVPLPDGSLLWVGRTFSPENAIMPDVDCIKAYRLYPDGTMEFSGQIENVQMDDRQLLSCEPHAIVLEDGTILVHIRVHSFGDGDRIFTLFQSQSHDWGKTWTAPKQILPDSGGAPAHLYRHSSGVLLYTYGHRGTPFRVPPFGIKVMFSRDNGKTWDTDHRIYTAEASLDLGYPSTVELSDGSLLTVFYGIPVSGAPAVIMQQRWRFV